jgi:hypothetical protein
MLFYKFFACVLVFVLFLVSAQGVFVVKGGSTLKVPQDYPTIQDAVNNANMGDIIVVSNGIYHENIQFLTSRVNNVVLMGSGNTVLDGVIAIYGETSNVAIKHMIIRSGGIEISGNGTVMDDVRILDSGVGIRLGANNIKIINTYFDNVGHPIEAYELPSWIEIARKGLIIDNVSINKASLSIRISDYDNIIISKLRINDCASGLLLTSRFNETNIEIRESNIICDNEGIHVKIFGNVKISNTYLKGGSNGIIIESEDPERMPHRVIINGTVAENFKVNGMSINGEFVTLTNLKIFNNTYGLNLKSPIFNITNSSFIKNGAKTYALSIASLKVIRGLIYLNEFIDNNGFDITYIGTAGTEKNIKLNSETKLSYVYAGKILINYLGNYWSKNIACRDMDNNGICDTPYNTTIIYRRTLTDYYPLARPLNYYKLTITTTSITTTTTTATTITTTLPTTTTTTVITTTTTVTTSTYDYTMLGIVAIILIIIIILIAFLILRRH